LARGGARWPPIHRAAASPARRGSGVKAVATWRACRMATEARHGFHRGAPFRGRFARRARRSGAVEPISISAILQAILLGAAVALHDEPADRARQGLAGKPRNIGHRDCARCGIPWHERVQRYLSSGDRANTYRLSPRPRMMRGMTARLRKRRSGRRLACHCCGRRKRATTAASVGLRGSVLDLGLDEHGEETARRLPAELTGLARDGRRQALLDDIDLRADRHRLQGDGGDHLTEQVRILEAIRVADELIWNEIQVLAAEDVPLADGEICE